MQLSNFQHEHSLIFKCLFVLLFLSELSILEDNSELQNILSEIQMPTMKYGTLKVAGYGETCLKISCSMFEDVRFQFWTQCIDIITERVQK